MIGAIVIAFFVGVFCATAVHNWHDKDGLLDHANERSQLLWVTLEDLDSRLDYSKIDRDFWPKDGEYMGPIEKRVHNVLWSEGADI